MPDPKEDESEQEFVSRYMGDDHAKKFPPKQRAAIAYSTYERKSKKKASAHALVDIFVKDATDDKPKPAKSEGTDKPPLTPDTSGGVQWQKTPTLDMSRPGRYLGESAMLRPSGNPGTPKSPSMSARAFSPQPQQPSFQSPDRMGVVDEAARNATLPLARPPQTPLRSPAQAKTDPYDSEYIKSYYESGRGGGRLGKPGYLPGEPGRPDVPSPLPIRPFPSAGPSLPANLGDSNRNYIQQQLREAERNVR